MKIYSQEKIFLHPLKMRIFRKKKKKKSDFLKFKRTVCARAQLFFYVPLLVLGISLFKNNEKCDLETMSYVQLIDFSIIHKRRNLVSEKLFLQRKGTF